MCCSSQVASSEACKGLVVQLVRWSWLLQVTQLSLPFQFVYVAIPAIVSIPLTWMPLSPVILRL